MSRLRRELDRYYLEYDIKKQEDLSEAENSRLADRVKAGEELPAGTFEYEDENNNVKHTYRYYRVANSDVSPEEMLDYIALRQLTHIRTIKNCVVFFVIAACIGLVAALVMMTRL